MSTIKTTYIQHPSATNPNIELSADGTVALPLSGIGDLANVDEGSGAADGDVLTYDGVSDLWVPAPSAVGGKVLQVQSSLLTGNWSTTSGTFQEITGLSVSITPSSTLSKILVLVNVHAIANTTDYGAYFQLRRNGTDIAKSTASTSSTHTFGATQFAGFGVAGSGISVLDSPSSTSSVTYAMFARVHTGAFSGSVLVNRSQNNASGTVSSITAIEVAS